MSAEHATGAQIEQLGASVRRARRAADVRARRRASYVRWHQEEDGSIVGSFRLAPEQAAVFCHAMDAARGRVADAFLRDISTETSGEQAERFQLILHTTEAELAKPDHSDDDGTGSHLTGGNGRAWRVAPSTARRLSCDCPSSTMVDGPDGAALHLGRRTRRIQGRLRRALHARDQGICRAPGCTERATQIHHLRHWAMGGPSCLRNLISLCDAHHWLVHEGGFLLAVRDGGGWVLISPEGVRVGPAPVPHVSAEPLAVRPDVAPDAVTGRWDGGRLDPDPIVAMVLGHQYDGSAETLSVGTWVDADNEDERIDYAMLGFNRFTT